MASDNRCITDYEEILKVFPPSVRESWKDSPDVVLYLSDLSSIGLQRLNQEPERLAEEKSAILEQTQDLAFRNYKTFIQTAECSHEIFQDFNIIEERLESMLGKMPEFSRKCEGFGKEAQQINERWHQSSLILTKHPHLLEFLELPQLMDTYVRNVYYEEALELASYVRRLNRKHNSIPIIASIVTDVQTTLGLMLSQLLMQLRSNIQLPACLKVIGFLRRMDVFSELELRIKFLQARDSWFQGILKEISKSDAHQHIIKVIENSRIYLFDIITQYRAIFSDDDPLLLTTKDSGQSETAIFQSWITMKILEFLRALETDLASDLGGRIDSVFAQCMYFGLSFSRVGIDFRPLMVSVFENATLFRFCSSAQSATSTFEEIMQSYTITNFTITTITDSMSQSFFSEESLQPPNSLLNFNPLAQYCNDILVAFNELKLCTSLSVAADVTSCIENSLKHVAKSIAEFEETEKTTMTENENEFFINFCSQFADELLPHLQKCLFVLFSPSELANILGVTSLEFEKIGKICSLDTDSILLPLINILPPKEEEAGITITVSPQRETDEETNSEPTSNEN